MTDKLITLVQQHAEDAIVKNKNVPNTQNNAAIKSVAEGILSGLQKQASGSGFGSVLNMLANGSGASNSIAKSVQGSVIDSLISKTGLGKSVATSIAASVVPSILGSLSKNTADPKNKNFDLSSILGSLTGGKTNGLNVASLLDQNGDGKLDLNDLGSFLGNQATTKTTTSKTTKSKKKTQVSSTQSSGGGILGNILGNLLGGK